MASTIKVNNIQNQCGANIANKCGSTVTLGASGDTITLACGASQTGFGRTGTVDWDTTAKTASFTAVSGNGYFCNTTSSAFTATLPAGSAGAIVSFADYAGTWQTNNLTVSPDGTDKIGGVNTDVTLSTEGQSVTFVYIDSTQGWINTMDSTSNVRGNAFISATGGTITCCGDYKIHTFTGPGTFTVTNAGAPTGSNTVDYLVVAGGAAGGTGDVAGGGGAGGYRESSGAASGCYTASPLGACVSALPVTATAYPITVGGGGAASCSGNRGNAGSNSVFSTITSAGGGGGGGDGGAGAGGSGGSGGGAEYNTATGGTGNTPPVSPPQGGSGGGGSQGISPPGSLAFGAGGGGGAINNGADGTPTAGGPGGNGATTSISASPTTYAGGGGGANEVDCSPVPGGSGGGGAGGSPTSRPGTAGTANTGGGGGGSDGNPAIGGSGGSGIVIIRYKYQ